MMMIRVVGMMMMMLRVVGMMMMMMMLRRRNWEIVWQNRGRSVANFTLPSQGLTLNDTPGKKLPAVQSWVILDLRRRKKRVAKAGLAAWRRDKTKSKILSCSEILAKTCLSLRNGRWRIICIDQRRSDKILDLWKSWGPLDIFQKLSKEFWTQQFRCGIYSFDI